MSLSKEMVEREEKRSLGEKAGARDAIAGVSSLVRLDSSSESGASDTKTRCCRSCAKLV